MEQELAQTAQVVRNAMQQMEHARPVLTLKVFPMELALTVIHLSSPIGLLSSARAATLPVSPVTLMPTTVLAAPSTLGSRITLVLPARMELTLTELIPARTAPLPTAQLATMIPALSVSPTSSLWVPPAPTPATTLSATATSAKLLTTRADASNVLRDFPSTPPTSPAPSATSLTVSTARLRLESARPATLPPTPPSTTTEVPA